MAKDVYELHKTESKVVKLNHVKRVKILLISSRIRRRFEHNTIAFKFENQNFKPN